MLAAGSSSDPDWKAEQLVNKSFSFFFFLTKSAKLISLKIGLNFR